MINYLEQQRESKRVDVFKGEIIKVVNKINKVGKDPGHCDHDHDHPVIAEHLWQVIAGVIRYSDHLIVYHTY
jgi:hypothetical protein